MPYSTCCGAHTTMEEIDICPECLEHCDWEDEDEIEKDKETENQIDQAKIDKYDKEQLFNGAGIYDPPGK